MYTCRKISTRKGKPKIVETRQFKNFNRRAFESDLNQAFVGNDVYHDNDPNEIWKVWKSIFLSIADKHAGADPGGIESSSRYGQIFLTTDSNIS